MKRQIALLLLFLPITLFAQLPRTLPYQGVYTDTLGNPKGDGTYTFTFRLYSVSSGGSALWTEIKDLQVKKGLFETRLGDTTPFGAGLTFDTQYYLGVKVGADPELSPRVALLPVPSSLFAAKSDTSRYAAGIADNSVTSAKIASSAVTAAKILDEPGIKYLDYSGSDTVSTVQADCQVASVTLVAPASGYVMVTASGWVNVYTAGTHMYRIKVSMTSSDIGEAAGVLLIRMPGASSEDLFPYSVSRAFPVSAGSRTFYLNMWHQTAPGVSLYNEYTLIAQYFPTQY
jgi:hypothetical protein